MLKRCTCHVFHAKSRDLNIKTMQLPRALMSSKWMCTVNPRTIRCIPTLILAITIHLIQKTINIITSMGFQPWFSSGFTTIVRHGALGPLASILRSSIAGSVDGLVQAALRARWLQWTRTETIPRVLGAGHEHQGFNGVLFHECILGVGTMFVEAVRGGCWCVCVR